MKEVIYLMGQISVDEEITYKWRQEVRRYFRDKRNFKIIDPCDNEFNMSNTNFIGEDLYRTRLYKSKGIGLIVPKDYSYVLRSTGCIVNMNQYDKDKPIIGTLFELAWMYQNQEKCVIGVFSGDHEEDIYCSHPFVKETVDIWCKNHMEAAEMLYKYYNWID